MKIFLSTPISCFTDNNELLKYKKSVLDLIKVLSPKYDVCSEITKISTENDYDTPSKSIKMDLEAVESSDVFVLHYPQKEPTSALIELGFAIALKKKIIIITPRLSQLPYLARGIESKDSNSIIIESDDLTSKTVITTLLQL